MDLGAVLFVALSLGCVAGGASMVRKGWNEGIRAPRTIAFRQENIGRDARIAGMVYILTGALVLIGGVFSLSILVKQSL